MAWRNVSASASRPIVLVIVDLPVLRRYSWSARLDRYGEADRGNDNRAREQLKRTRDTPLNAER